MKTYLDCYPCFVRQALDAARFAGAGEAQQLQVLRDTLAVIQDLDPAITPPEIGDRIHRQVRKMVDNVDPYKQVKDAATDEALRLLPTLRAGIADAEDPLEMAFRMAIAGNIIDFGYRPDYDLCATIEEVMTRDLAVNDVPALRTALHSVWEAGDGVLYLADNAGETVFDRALIETLAIPVTYVVKGGPVLNDAVWEDAARAGIQAVATLVDTGADTPGTILSRTSEAFRRRFETAKVIIAKGQANYETLSPGDPRMFFVLKAKCPVIARDLGVETGGLVVKQGRATVPEANRA